MYKSGWTEREIISLVQGVFFGLAMKAFSDNNATGVFIGLILISLLGLARNIFTRC